MIDLLLWLIVGSVAGWISSRVMMKTRRGESSASDVFVGIAGAVLGGGLIPARIGMHRAAQPELFSPGALLVAVVSAIVLLIVVNVVCRSPSH